MRRLLLLLMLILPLHLVWGDVVHFSEMKTPAVSSTAGHCVDVHPDIAQADDSVERPQEVCHAHCQVGLEAISHAGLPLTGLRELQPELAAFSYTSPHLPGPDRPSWHPLRSS